MQVVINLPISLAGTHLENSLWIAGKNPPWWNMSTLGLIAYMCPETYTCKSPMASRKINDSRNDECAAAGLQNSSMAVQKNK